ncbi:MAG: hypothetical protein IIX48_11820 [Lachnospiraceae bacterium]|nr:hypothetical protein [Lachnospiraceae bacterium]
MMISPESFYHMELEGKSISQIEKVIRKLKKEMTNLKKAIECPDPEAPSVLMEPSLEVQLKCTREYLERAKVALVEAGGEYVPNQAEQRVIDFDNNIEFISKIRFDIGGFFNGNQIFTYSISGDKVTWDRGGFSFVDFKLPEYTPQTKKELLDAFREFHIGEWKHKYVDPYVLDGTQWGLEIEYSNGRKTAKYYGSNAFPFNFDEFSEFMGDIPYSDEEE